MLYYIHPDVVFGGAIYVDLKGGNFLKGRKRRNGTKKESRKGKGRKTSEKDRKRKLDRK